MANQTWAQERFAQIKKDAKAEYGAGWRHLSEQQKTIYVESRVLALLLAQSDERFSAAQNMVQSVLTVARYSK